MKITKFILFVSIIALMTACGSNKEEKVADTVKVETKTETAINGTAMPISADNAVIHWKGGKKVGGSHEGTVTLKSGNIIANAAGVVGGNFVMDMATIADVDKDADLEGHLKAADFFDVANFATATYDITKVATLINNPKGSHMVYGNMTIKGITQPVNFMANIAKSGTGYEITAPTFKIDRTKFNVKYNSSKFFDNLKDKVINDEIELTIKLKA